MERLYTPTDQIDDILEEIDEEDIDYNALGQAYDTTFGRTSTPMTAQHSVKFQLSGSNRLVASYAAIVKFTSQKQMIEHKRAYEKESIDVINAHVKAVQSRYKDICGKTLKVKELGSTPSVEIIGMNFYNPNKSCYVRRKTVFEIS